MKIHFVCRGNTYRSRLAEAYTNSLKLENIAATSSGIEAVDNFNGDITPYAKRILDEKGLASHTSNTWHQTTQELLQNSDVIVFMDGLVFEFAKKNFDLSSKRLEVWEIKDIFPKLTPAGEIVPRSETTFGEICRHVDELVKSIK